jgi:molybdenum cofactor biosynthesis protein A
MFARSANTVVRRALRTRWNPSLCRVQSSRAAHMAEEEEPEATRPRLESLRRQLEQEQGDGLPHIQISESKSQKPAAVSSELDELLQQLDSLPLPQEPLKDTFGRQHSYLRISLSEKCNLRCLYCMPEDGVPVQPQSHLLSNDEILQLATWFVGQGVDKVRLTGGEPLLRKDLVDLVGRLSDLGLEQIGMTTNGVTLSKQLPELVEAGLTHVNISLDSLEPDKFARLTRRPPSYHARVIQAIEDCAVLLPHRTKINCVVLPDNVGELEDFCELTRQLPIDVRFIEYMPFNDNLWQAGGFVSYQQMQDQIQGLERLQDGPNDTTKWWGLTPKDQKSGPALGRVGFITSMSEHFCGTCNRLRLTADGKLKVCLFGKTEVSLRDLMRSGGSEEALQKLIHHSVQKKHFKLGGHKDMEDLKAHSTENRPMILIGG